MTVHVRVADEFVSILRSWLTVDEFKLIRERNARETNTGICHSHDFCDANVCMLAAYKHVVGDAFNDEGHITDDANAVMSAAWNFALADQLTERG
jgi:hypothetical protein